MKYQLWDKQSDIITPSGAVFTAEQWKDRYPWTRISGAQVVIANGFYNGGFIGEFTSMQEAYEKRGADFSDCQTSEDVLQAMEDFDIAKAAQAAEHVTAEERIAAQLEFQSMMLD